MSTYAVADGDGNELTRAGSLDRAARDITGHLLRDKAITREEADAGPDLRELAEAPQGYPPGTRTWEYYAGGRGHERFIVELPG